MRHKEAPAVLPEERPDHLAVGIGDGQVVFDVILGVPFERAFAHRPLFHIDRLGHLIQKHEPVHAVIEAGLRDDAGQVKLFGGKLDSGFFLDFADGTGGGAFTNCGFELAPDRRVEVAVGRPAAVQQQPSVGLVAEVAENGDAVGQLGHAGDDSRRPRRGDTAPAGMSDRRMMGRWCRQARNCGLLWRACRRKRRDVFRAFRPQIAEE